MPTQEPEVVDQRVTLLECLHAQRRHVLGIVEGLTDEDFRRAVLPSGWSPLGILQHLTLDDERFWFQAVVAGNQDVIAGLNEESSAWEVDPGASAQDVLGLYRREIDRSNSIIASTPLNAPPTWWPDFFGDFRLRDLHEIMLHVIAETACHAGHLDAVREIIDGRQWLVLTE